MRPHIFGRPVLGVRRALVALCLLCVATGAPVALAASAVGPSTASQAPLGPLPGLSPGAVGAPFTPVAVLARVHTRLVVHSAILDVLDGQVATVRGALRPKLPGRVVVLQSLDRKGWRTISRAHTGARGRFVLRYIPRRLLSERLRIVFAGDRGDLPARRSVGRLRSYRLVDVSWYGGGGGLACGGNLTSATMGVANKTLPCGTQVTLRYNGRSVRVPVVDRGPYVSGREFDLTEATKNALGFEGVGMMWSTR